MGVFLQLVAIHGERLAKLPSLGDVRAEVTIVCHADCLGSWVVWWEPCRTRGSVQVSNTFHSANVSRGHESTGCESAWLSIVACARN
eukprot:5039434-Amphidinium_carterae.1